MNLFIDADSAAPLTPSVWDAAYKASVWTLSNVNRTATYGAGTGLNTRSTVAKSSGKWYWEILVGGTPNLAQTDSPSVAMGDPTINNATPAGNSTTAFVYSRDGSKTSATNRLASWGAAYGAGDVIGVAVDLDAHKIWFAKNNVWQGAGADPVAGVFPAYQFTATTLHQLCSADVGTPAVTLQSAAAVQTYSPPSGFSAWG